MSRLAVALLALPCLLAGCCLGKASPGDLIRLEEAINDPDAYAARVERECAEDRAESCTSLGLQTANGTYGRIKDQAAAIPLYEKACDLGDPYGCHEIGVACMYGKGVEIDLDVARTRFEGSCDDGVSNSCYYLAGFYERGEGVTQDAERAREYYAMACDLGDTSACGR